MHALTYMHTHPYEHTLFSTDLAPGHPGATFLHGNNGLKQNSDYLPAGLCGHPDWFQTVLFAVLGIERRAFSMLDKCSATKLVPSPGKNTIVLRGTPYGGNGKETCPWFNI